MICEKCNTEFNISFTRKNTVRFCPSCGQKTIPFISGKDTCIQMSDLVGLGKLSGAENEVVHVHQYGDVYEEANCLYFIIDNKTYCAAEDPSDGYRSMLAGIYLSEHEVKNTFEPQQVMGIVNEKIITFYDVKTGKPVLSIGTDDYDDYYPTFVASFNPENMAVNND